MARAQEDISALLRAVAGAVVLVAFSVSSREALHVTLLYLGVQTVEGNVTAPLIQRYTINLHRR